MASRHILYSICFLFLCLNLTLALKCFQCQLRDGVGDAGCGEHPPPEKYIRECLQPQCWMRYSNNGTLSIERFCVAVATNMNGCMPSMVEDNQGMQHTARECKCSHADGCNGKSPSEINISSGGGHQESATEHG